MNSANKLNAYRVNAVSTASAENLVVMLYDGAIRFMGMAIRAFDKEDPLDFNLAVHTNITKTQAIVRELSRSLDPEKAGELGESLISLYDYFDNRLQEANIHKDKAIIEEVLERVTELRDAWNESLNKSDEAALPVVTGPTAAPTTAAYAPSPAAPAPVAPQPAPQPMPQLDPAAPPAPATPANGGGGFSLMG